MSMTQIVEDRRQSKSSAAMAATVDIPVEITREQSKLESQRGVPDGPGNEESFLPEDPPSFSRWMWGEMNRTQIALKGLYVFCKERKNEILLMWNSRKSAKV